MAAAQTAARNSTRARYLTVSTDEADWDKEGSKLERWALDEADKLTGQYYEAGTYEDRFFYVRQVGGEELYIFRSSYTDTEGYWSFSPVLGGSWATCLAYSTADTRDLVPPIDDWMMRGRKSYHIRCPIKVSRPKPVNPTKNALYDCLCAPWAPPPIKNREIIDYKAPERADDYNETEDIVIGEKSKQIMVEGVMLTLKPKVEHFQKLPPPPGTQRLQWVRLRIKHAEEEIADSFLVEHAKKYAGDYIERGTYEDRVYYARKGANNKTWYIFWSSDLNDKGSGGWYLGPELGAAWTLSDLWSKTDTEIAPHDGWMMRDYWGYTVPAPLFGESGVHHKKVPLCSCFAGTRKKLAKDTSSFDIELLHELGCDVTFFDALRDEFGYLLQPVKRRGRSLTQRASVTVDQAGDSCFNIFCLEMGCIVPFAAALGDLLTSTQVSCKDKLLCMLTGKSLQDLNEMRSMKTDEQIWKEAWARGEKRTKSRWALASQEMGCEVPFSVGLEDLLQQLGPLWKDCLKDMGVKVPLKGALYDFGSTYFSPVKNRCLLSCRRATTKLKVKSRAAMPKPKDRGLELSFASGLGVDKEFVKQDDLRMAFILLKGVKPDESAASLFCWLDDDPYFDNEYVNEAAAKLTGYYLQHLSPYEDKPYYQRVEEGDRPNLYIHWGPAWKTEGAWFIADGPGQKWLAYNDEQSQTVPLTGWRIRNEVRNNVESPLIFELQGSRIKHAMTGKVTRELRQLESPREEDSKSTACHSVLAGALACLAVSGACIFKLFERQLKMRDRNDKIRQEMACETSLAKAIEDLCANGPREIAGFRGSLAYPELDEVACKYYPPGPEDGLVYELALYIPFVDALEYATDSIFNPQTERQTAEALGSAADGSHRLVRRLSTHQATATCFDYVFWRPLECLGGIVEYCLADPILPPKPKPPPVVEQKRELVAEPEPVVEGITWQGKVLVWSENPEAWYCNLCFDTYPTNHETPHYRCEECDYDICPKCLPSVLGQEKPKAVLAPDEDLTLDLALQLERKVALDLELESLKRLKEREEDLKTQIANRTVDNDALRKQVLFQSQLRDQRANEEAMRELQAARIRELEAELRYMHDGKADVGRRMADLEALVKARHDEVAILSSQHSQRLASLQRDLQTRREMCTGYELRGKEAEVLYEQRIQDAEAQYLQQTQALEDQLTQIRAAYTQLHRTHTATRERHSADTDAIVQQHETILQDTSRKTSLLQGELNSMKALLDQADSQALAKIESAKMALVTQHQAFEAQTQEQIRRLSTDVALSSQRNAELEAMILQAESKGVATTTLPSSQIDMTELTEARAMIQELQEAQLANDERIKSMQQAQQEQMDTLAAKIAAAKEQQASSDQALVVEKFVADSMDGTAMSLEVGQTVTVIATKGQWATVKHPSGQTGDAPLICLQMQGSAPAAPAPKSAVARRLAGAGFSPSKQVEKKSQFQADLAQVQDEIRQVQANLDMMRISHTSRVVELETDVKSAKGQVDTIKRELEVNGQKPQAPMTYPGSLTVSGPPKTQPGGSMSLPPPPTSKLPLSAGSSSKLPPPPSSAPRLTTPPALNSVKTQVEVKSALNPYGFTQPAAQQAPASVPSLRSAFPGQAGGVRVPAAPYKVGGSAKLPVVGAGPTTSLSGSIQAPNASLKVPRTNMIAQNMNAVTSKRAAVPTASGIPTLAKPSAVRTGYRT